MNAAGPAFRFRVVIFVLLYLLGFFPPWDFRNGSRTTLWLAAAAQLARTGRLGLETATRSITVVALACLVLGATLRVWGTAYIGSGVMRGARMQGDDFIAAGPYRHLRNPLYVGAWLLAIGASILMPPGGAIFFVAAFTLFVLFLISAEERFLSAKLGDAYQQYVRHVPRLWPRIAAGGDVSPRRSHWGTALLNETFPVAFTLCFAVFAWRYNARLLIQCLLICWGLSLVVRALTKPHV